MLHKRDTIIDSEKKYAVIEIYKEIIGGTMNKYVFPLIIVMSCIFQFTAYTSGTGFYTMPDGYVYIEAEDIITDNQTAYTIQNAQYSGGEYVSFNSSLLDSGLIEAPVLSCPFTVPNTGVYYVWVRVNVINAATDSFFGGFDETYSTVQPPVDPQNINWIKISTKTLSAGTHTLDIHPREAGIKIDKILITSLGMFIPTGESLTPEDEPSQTVVYDTPEFTPPAGHPRVYFSSEDIPVILANAQKPQNIKNWERHLSNLEYITDGTLPMASGNTNFDSKISEVIESLAFDYAIRNNEQAGYKAIIAIKNFVNTLTTDQSDYINTPGMYNYTSQTINTIGIVYDWCYNLLTNEDKSYFHKMFLYMAHNTEMGWPPIKQNGYTGHGAEGQLQRDMMCAAIAMYDEYPYIYDNVGGKFFEEYIDPKLFMYQGFTHNEGDHYFQIRYQWEILTTLLFDNLGMEKVFGSNQQYVPYWYLYARRPDGSVLRSGDSLQDGYPLGDYYDFYYRPLLLASNYYHDPYLKWEALRENPGLYPQNSDYNRTINCVEFLIFNNPDLEGRPVSELPLTMYYPAPFGGMIARTGWGEGVDSPAVVAEMKIKEYWMPSHAHLDAGAFQIYYKGALANDTGFYASSKGSGSVNNNSGNTYFGSDHFYNYYRRSIAHNCMLILDPNEKSLHALDGGQKYLSDVSENTFDEFMTNYEDHRTGKVLGHEFGPDPMEPDYTYLKGDLSYAYSDKVSAYERSFMFLNLKNAEHPAAMLVFDRVVSSNPTFKKTWLLHGLFEPEINGTQTTFKDTREGYNGKLTVDTLLPEADNASISKIGGAGMDFYVNGTNWNGIPSLSGANENANGWRMEVSPASESYQDYFLHVLQVEDLDTNPISVTKIDAGTHIGARIANRIVLFGKNKDRISDDVTITVSGDDNYEVTVADIQEGTWEIYKDSILQSEAIATKEGGVLVFNANSGNYTLKYKNTNSQREPVIHTIPTHVPLSIMAQGKYIYNPVRPIITTNDVLISAESLTKALSLVAEYDYDNKSVKLISDYGKEITMIENAQTAITDRGETNITSPAIIAEDHFLLPLSFVCNEFFTEIDHYSESDIININSPENTIYTVSVDCGEGGSVSTNSTVYTPPGENVLLTITPDPGYVIDAVLFNNIQITAISDDGGSYTTPQITKNSTFSITFKEDIRKPEIKLPKQKFNGVVDYLSLREKVSEEELSTVMGKDAVFAFASNVNKNESYDLMDFGMILSRTDISPQLNEEHCIKISVKNKFSKTMGNYGILIYGNSIVSGNSYYLRPYAIYQKNGILNVIYGETDIYLAGETLNNAPVTLNDILMSYLSSNRVTTYSLNE